MYSLNKYKFNNKIFLPILSKILNKIIRKKIEYNIINLKSITFNTDLFTNALALKLKTKQRVSVPKNMFSILNRAYLPIIDTQALKASRSFNDNGCLGSLNSQTKNKNLFLNAPHKYKDLKLISMLGPQASTNNTAYRQKQQLETSLGSKKIINRVGLVSTKNFDQLLGKVSTTKQVHNTIYNSIDYKNMRGIRLEIKGRLTKRYRADRSVCTVK